MINKSVTVMLSQEEVDSPEDIQIVLTIKLDGSDEGVDYTITYPKGKQDEQDPDDLYRSTEVPLPTKEQIAEFLASDPECQKILNK